LSWTRLTEHDGVARNVADPLGLQVTRKARA
jgi:hypothetical protein